MKYISFFFLVLLLVISSCLTEDRLTICNGDADYPVIREESRDDICNSDSCFAYLDIWRELIQEKNNWNPDFMDKHIELLSAGYSNWNDGISFRVGYKIQIDWATAYYSDSFMTIIFSDDGRYPHLDLPRNTLLSKSEITSVVNNRAFSSSIAEITNSSDLFHSSFEDALNDLIAKSSVNKLCFSQVKLNRFVNGNLIMFASAEYESEENSCIFGEMDLITGKVNVWDSPCFF